MLSKMIFKYDAIFFIKNSFSQIGTSCTVQQLYFIHIYVGTISAYTFIVNYLNLNCQANNSFMLCSFILYYWSNKGHIYNLADFFAGWHCFYTIFRLIGLNFTIMRWTAKCDWIFSSKCLRASVSHLNIWWMSVGWMHRFPQILIAYRMLHTCLDIQGKNNFK